MNKGEPKDKSKPWLLPLRACMYRWGASLAFSMYPWYNTKWPSPSSSFYIDSITSRSFPQKEAIRIDVWETPRAKHSTNEVSASERPLRSAVINFHGGGFILGKGTDDRLWVGALLEKFEQLDGIVVFSVNYRLAPTYPFPTAVEDGVDAIREIARRTEVFHIDPTKIVLSGFSAGACLSLSTFCVLQNPSQWGYDVKGESPSQNEPYKYKELPIQMAGIVAFYPLLDVTISRETKRRKMERPERSLQNSITDIIDNSYFPAQVRKSLSPSDTRHSPGRMSDDFIRDFLPPVHICLCEDDMLLGEGKAFAKRIESLATGEQEKVTMRIVENEVHGWDKQPFVWNKPSVQREYDFAIEQIIKWVG